MMLNLGCGDHRAPAPWVNIDRWPGVHPDVVASADALPFRSGSVERLYCGHLLEHLEWETELPEALAEIRRVTDSVCFVGPDYDRAQARAIVFCKLKDAEALEHPAWCENHEARANAKYREITWGELQSLDDRLQQISAHGGSFHDR